MIPLQSPLRRLLAIHRACFEVKLDQAGAGSKLEYSCAAHLQESCDINVDDVPIFESPGVWDPMTEHLVHRGTHTFREGACVRSQMNSAACAKIIGDEHLQISQRLLLTIHEGGWVGAMVNDHFVHHAVYLICGDASLHMPQLAALGMCSRDMQLRGTESQLAVP